MNAVVDARIVRARTAREIENFAASVRESLGLPRDGRVSMTPILELLLYDIVDDYQFRVRYDSEMGTMDGLTDCDRPVITLKMSVYAALQKKQGRARMTAAHEFGHLLMHCQMPFGLASSTKRDPLTDPERQADIFAAAFLMPREDFLRCRTVREAMNRFGVSHDAALCRARRLNHRFADTRTSRNRHRKKGYDKRRTP